MPKTSRSQTHAVFPHVQGLDVVFLRRISQIANDINGPHSRRLEWCYQHTGWPKGFENELIVLLTKAGLVVRHYDAEHKQWMETSLEEGPKPCEGNRDGSWAMPDLNEFERGYLRS